MKHAHEFVLGSLLFFLLVTTSGIISIPVMNDITSTADWPGGLIIDHTCIDLESIPSTWIDTAQSEVKIHYAHTSHGSQITTGLNRIESADTEYSQSQGYLELPADEGSLCILDGNPPHAYITPDLYWEGDGDTITQQTLDDNPGITVSLWSWCTQLNHYSTSQVQDYLDTMTALEDANPDVTFVYMTCNAQASGGDGYNRWVNNEMIRDYCTTNDKILFDFADLDAWSGGEQNTYEHTVDDTTYDIPLEHEDFNGNEAGHTTYSSCEQKGRAFWWLVASIAGWNAPTTTSSTSDNGTGTGSTDNPTDPQSPDYLVIGTAGGILAILVVATILYNKRLNK